MSNPWYATIASTIGWMCSSANRAHAAAAVGSDGNRRVASAASAAGKPAVNCQPGPGRHVYMQISKLGRLRRLVRHPGRGYAPAASAPGWRTLPRSRRRPRCRRPPRRERRAPVGQRSRYRRRELQSPQLFKRTHTHTHDGMHRTELQVKCCTKLVFCAVADSKVWLAPSVWNPKRTAWPAGKLQTHPTSR